MKAIQKNLKLAIQKQGRLTDDTISLLRTAGLEFENSKKRLFSSCRNFSLEILYVRDDDIAQYVQNGVVDIGIIGQNIVNEEMPKVKKVLNLRYGFCSLVLAVPNDSPIRKLSDIEGKQIATSYPNSAAYFLKQKKIMATLTTISGSVEITPALGIADAIIDLSSTGSTMKLNDLRILATLYSSEAVLIVNNQTYTDEKSRKLIDQLTIRFKGVLSAQKYRYILMNAPKKILPKLTKIIPGLKSPTIMPLAKPGWISVQSVVKEDIFWETIERLKKLGASGIIVLPIEKMIV